MAVSTLMNWRLTKPARRAAWNAADRYGDIDRYKSEAKRIKKYYQVSNDVTMRGSYFSLFQNVWLARILLMKPDVLTPAERAEKKKIIQRTIRQCRNMRLDFGLPKLFYLEQPFFVGPNNHVPCYSMPDAIAGGVEFHVLEFLMRGGQGQRIVDEMTRSRHAGLWSAEMMLDEDDEAVKTPQNRLRWSFSFQSETDLIMFRVKYSGTVEEA